MRRGYSTSMRGRTADQTALWKPSWCIGRLIRVAKWTRGLAQLARVPLAIQIDKGTKLFGAFILALLVSKVGRVRPYCH